MILLIAAACTGVSAAATITALRSARRLGLPSATEAEVLLLLTTWPFLLSWNEVNMNGERYQPGLGQTLAVCGLLGGMTGWFLSRGMLGRAGPRIRLAVIAGFALALTFAGYTFPSTTVICPTGESIVSDAFAQYPIAQVSYHSVEGRYASDLDVLCPHGLGGWIPQAARKVGWLGYRIYLLEPAEKDGMPPLCAHPIVYGRTALATLVAADSDERVFVKDTRGIPPEHWPEKPIDAGWRSVFGR